MQSIADQLLLEIAKQIHPDRRKHETDYWAVRDQLLDQYRDQWIGFADGRVVASGASPVAVFQAAEATGLHPFFICVGRESEPCRIRRAAFPYDARYPGEALPLVSIEFRSASGARGCSWIASSPIRERMRAFCPGRTVNSFSWRLRRGCRG